MTSQQQDPQPGVPAETATGQEVLPENPRPGPPPAIQGTHAGQPVHDDLVEPLQNDDAGHDSRLPSQQVAAGDDDGAQDAYVEHGKGHS
ncbi:MAG TPA: hypothetical protein VFL91_07180 [Thermomicrobiales bacterium]|nr:hypothetical protein [Thermomicrobiales bacterium]